jgi:hypothetical protein
MERLYQLLGRESIFSSYGTSLRGKTLAGFLSFPFIILSNRDGFYFLNQLNKHKLV